MPVRPLIIYVIFFVVIVLQLPAGLLMRFLPLPVAILINQVFILVFAPALILRLFKARKISLPLAQPRIRFIISAVIIAIAAGILIDYLVAATEHFINVPENIKSVYDRLITSENLFQYSIKLIFVAMLPAVCEEFFFRGICQTNLVARYGRWAGILIVSIMFAVAHTNPWYFHLYIILGIFLGWMYEVGKTLWIPITCHFVNNIWTLTIKYKGIEFPTGNNIMDYLVVTFSVVVFIFIARAITRSTKLFRQ